MLTVKNILAGQIIYDVWDVNQDAEYHESGKASDLGVIKERMVPETIGSKVTGKVSRHG